MNIYTEARMLEQSFRDIYTKSKENKTWQERKRKRDNILLLFIMVVVCAALLPLCSGQFIYKQNSVVDLKIPCTLDGASCSTGALCNLTIQYPNSTYLVNSGIMTRQDNGDFNYTIEFNKIGVHPSKVSCVDGGQNDTSTFDITVNGTGTEFTTSQGIVYLIFILGGVGMFIFCLYYAIKLPLKNARNEEGEVIGINWHKYLKFMAIVGCYIILLMLMGFLRGITEIYAPEIGVSGLFNWAYWIMLSAMFPLIIAGLILALIVYIQDKKFLKALEDDTPLQ